MEAGSQGQGRGARRLWAPLCARDLPSSTLRLLPGPWAPNRASDLPGYGELHFRTPENSSKPLRMRAGLLAGVAFLPGHLYWVAGASADPLSARRQRSEGLRRPY